MMQPDSMARSIRFANIMDRSLYKFRGKLALFMQLGTFFMMKAKQDKMNIVHFNFTLLMQILIIEKSGRHFGD